MQIATEFGREGGGLTSVMGIGPPPPGFSYQPSEILDSITPPIPPSSSISSPVSSPGLFNGGAFIIGMIILGMSGFRA